MEQLANEARLMDLPLSSLPTIWENYDCHDQIITTDNIAVLSKK